MTATTTTYYDRDGDTYQAETAHAAADQAYGPNNHDVTSMWSRDGATWTEHVLGSGAADIECEAPPFASDYGALHDYDTAAVLRPATRQERDDSREAARHDGGAGVIRVDGRRCYVQE